MSIDCLPNEMLMHIFAHLDVARGFFCALVCQKWNDILTTYYTENPMLGGNCLPGKDKDSAKSTMTVSGFDGEKWLNFVISPISNDRFSIQSCVAPPMRITARAKSWNIMDYAPSMRITVWVKSWNIMDYKMGVNRLIFSD